MTRRSTCSWPHNHEEGPDRPRPQGSTPAETRAVRRRGTTVRHRPVGREVARRIARTVGGLGLSVDLIQRRRRCRRSRCRRRRERPVVDRAQSASSGIAPLAELKRGMTSDARWRSPGALDRRRSPAGAAPSPGPAGLTRVANRSRAEVSEPLRYSAKEGSSRTSRWRAHRRGRCRCTRPRRRAWRCGRAIRRCGAHAGASVGDVGIALRGHRPRGGVDELAGVGHRIAHWTLSMS